MSALDVAGGVSGVEQTADYEAAQESVLQASTAERVNLNQEVLFADIPEAAHSHLNELCTTEELPYVTDYLRTTKAAEFGGDLSILPVEMWPLIVEDCRLATSEKSEIAELDKGLEEDDENLADRRSIRAEKTENLAQETDALEKDKTTLNVLRNSIAEELEGENSLDQITKAKQIISDRPLDENTRTELLAWIEGIEATANQVSALAQTPEEQAEIARIFGSTSLDLTSDNMAGTFSQFVLQSDASDVLSEATKSTIASTLDAPRFSTDTGSQVDSALGAKNTDGEPLYTPQNPLAVRDGVAAYVAPDGSRVARVEVEGVGVREIPWEANDDGTTIGLKLSLLKIWAVNEAKGNTDFLGETVNINTQVVSQTNPESLRKTQLVMEALLGGDAGFDGEIITDEQADYLAWFSQYVAVKGDASEGDYNEEVADQNRINLGLHPNGDTSKLDYEVLQAAGRFAQGQYGSGSPDYDALQAYLSETFPEKDIPHPDDQNQNQMV